MKVNDWTAQLQGFKGETGLKRFNLWMDAVVHAKGQDPEVMDKIDSMVKAAGTSQSFRAKLFKFAAGNVQVPRKLLGKQQTDLAKMKSEDVDDAHNLLIEHQVSDPQANPRQAYEMLGQKANQNPFFRELLKLTRPRPGSQPAHVPPLLKAYVETHDEEGKAIMDARRSLQSRQGRGPDEAAAHAVAMQTNDALLHGRYVAVASQLTRTTSPDQ